MGGGWYLECDLRSVDLDAAALGRLLLILSANLDLAGDPASVRLARVLRVVDHGDDLEREPEIDRLRLDLIIEDARVIEGDRKSRAMKLSPNLAVTGISELAACVVQLADQSRHLRRLLMMIGRAARPDPEAT
jgi:hypothetical protein